MKIKILYWKLESFFYQFFAMFFIFPSRQGGRKHELPQPLIVSLTSYRPRFFKLKLTIKTLISQSVKPDKIILWIAEDEKKFLPDVLFKYEKKYKWFEIRFCEDIRSYKKIIPSLIYFPDAFIVTSDDDIFYPKNWLEGLCEAWQGDFNQVVAYRTHLIHVEKDGNLSPYNSWKHNIHWVKHNTGILFPTSGSGVLYPPGVFDPQVTYKDLFMSLCPNADDVWLFWMLNLKSAKVVKTKKRLNLVCWPGSDEGGLAAENVINNGNDLQIKNMQRKFRKIKNINDKN